MERSSLKYAEFVGKSEDTESPRKYWIEIPSEQYFSEIINHLNGFSKEEAISKYMKGYTDKVCSSEAEIGTYNMLRKNISLACFTENDGETKLTGFNILNIERKDEVKDNTSSGWFLPFLSKMMNYLDGQRNVYEEFEVDKIMTDYGLYVLPEFRGDGIAVQLLKARTRLCKDIGVKVTTTTFTSHISQRIAYKAGFKDLFCIDYEELARIKPEFYIPGIQEYTKSVKTMYKVME